VFARTRFDDICDGGSGTWWSRIFFVRLSRKERRGLERRVKNRMGQ
jgi:hypothetical protein